MSGKHQMLLPKKTKGGGGVATDRNTDGIPLADRHFSTAIGYAACVVFSFIGLPYL